MVLNLHFILAFVGVAVVLLISIMIFSDATDMKKISVNTDDVNCHVNYDHWSGCDQRTNFNGEKGNDYSTSMMVIGLIALLVIPIIVIVRLL